MLGDMPDIGIPYSASINLFICLIVCNISLMMNISKHLSNHHINKLNFVPLILVPKSNLWIQHEPIFIIRNFLSTQKEFNSFFPILCRKTRNYIYIFHLSHSRKKHHKSTILLKISVLKERYLHNFVMNFVFLCPSSKNKLFSSGPLL